MTLLEACLEEARIWSFCYLRNDQVSNRWIAFAEPERPEHPHWNLIFPCSDERGLSHEEGNQFREWYRSQGCKPHILDLQRSTESVVSQDWYFVHSGEGKVPPGSLDITETERLDIFSDALGRAFSLPADFVPYFTKKMTALREKVSSRFFIAKKDSDIVGCWSLFESSPSIDFMMNFGVVPEFKGRNLSSEIMEAVVSEGGAKQILTHTTNAILADKLLPRSGFTLLGEAQVRELFGR